jgi:phosphoribosylanthranilate isomerase
VAGVAGFADIADRLLLDAKPPKGAERPGGLGVTFDWNLLKALDPSFPSCFPGASRPRRWATPSARCARWASTCRPASKRRRASRTRLIRAFIEKARAAHG